MMPTTKTLIGYLPLAIFVAVMLWRLRTMDKARPLRLRTLWVLPLVFVVLVGFVLAKMPPSPWGVVVIAVGVLVGAGVGWQRARWMRLHLEREGGATRVMVRQSPAALLLLMGIAGLRTLFRSATGASAMSGTVHAGQLPVAALLFTDALLGFALGMIVAQRIELWRRARQLSREDALSSDA
jgi:O-antigen/teichoic acid export membrane protein